MKIRKILITTVAMAAIGAAGTAFAWPGEEPPPEPPKLNDCSPGFWKNHTEFWAGIGQYCGADPQACVDYTMGELTSKGSGSGDRRRNAADALNSWADSYYGALICTD